MNKGSNLVLKIDSQEPGEKIKEYRIKIPDSNKSICMCLYESKSISNKDIFSAQIILGDERLIVENRDLAVLKDLMPSLLTTMLEARGIYKDNDGFFASIVRSNIKTEEKDDYVK